MYSPRRTYGSPPPELSNNPFIDHPSNALARFPDISGSNDLSGDSSQFAPWAQPSGSSLVSSTTGYAAQGAPAGYSNGYQQQPPMQLQPQQTSWNGGGGFAQPQQQGYVSQAPQISSPFQPSSSFGQQLAGQVNSTYTGMPQQQPQMQQQYSGYQTPQYGGAYQSGFPPQPNNQYLPEFDPYAQLQSTPFVATPSGGGNGQYRQLHPREYVQQHKAELEAWDGYAWKQIQNAFDALKEAWSARKRDVESRVRAMGGAGLFGGGGVYGGQAQEYARLESLTREAESNFDSVAASAFQMQEVYSGYRQSGDLASKRRVRESINAALSSLPDWPPQGL
ncbi:predicted protein [Sparassis crispa]|uniref:Uncharacterized protein n=1 Tax=Sparassis crispa TaxID=139825 RepID=A0A401H0W6_9APHY|nr:predicted protein [Sparassis crispa]GBE88030.1 predicted protein [Sparassis crispa]